MAWRTPRCPLRSLAAPQTSVGWAHPAFLRGNNAGQQQPTGRGLGVSGRRRRVGAGESRATHRWGGPGKPGLGQRHLSSLGAGSGGPSSDPECGCRVSETPQARPPNPGFGGPAPVMADGVKPPDLQSPLLPAAHAHTRAAPPTLVGGERSAPWAFVSLSVQWARDPRQSPWAHGLCQAVPHREAGPGVWGSPQAAASKPCPHPARRGTWATQGGFPHPAPAPSRGHSPRTKGACR